MNEWSGITGEMALGNNKESAGGYSDCVKAICGECPTMTHCDPLKERRKLLSTRMSLGCRPLQREGSVPGRMRRRLRNCGTGRLYGVTAAVRRRYAVKRCQAAVCMRLAEGRPGRTGVGTRGVRKDGRRLPPLPTI